MTSCDVIVIGGGHNGLVAATVLARSGRRVIVVEADSVLGGAARTVEFAPGYRVSGLAHLLNRLDPEVGRLIADAGTFIAGPSVGTVAISAEAPPLRFEGAYGERLGSDVLGAEAGAWAELRRTLLDQTGILKSFMRDKPPSLVGRTWAERLQLGQTALAVRRMGREGMQDFLRMLLMNVADVVDDHLSDDRLKGLLAFDATQGIHLGPRSPTSLLGLYYRLAAEAGGVVGAQILPRGGMGSVVDGLAAAARKAGADLRVGAPVGRVLVEKGRTLGVVLASGEEIRSSYVLSAISPKTTFLDLVGPRQLDAGFVRRIAHLRAAGNVARLHLALDRVPDFPGLTPTDLAGRLVVAPSVDHVERAFNHAKYGELSAAPTLEITLPSLSDPTLAPAGACVLSANVQQAPYALRTGWEAGRPALLAAAMRELERVAPGIGKHVVASEVLSPADIEARYRIPGGHWHHVEWQVDQLLMLRPTLGAAAYETPIAGLFIGAAGSHPGGGVSGLPGLNAARALLALEAMR